MGGKRVPTSDMGMFAPRLMRCLVGPSESKAQAAALSPVTAQPDRVRKSFPSVSLRKMPSRLHPLAMLWRGKAQLEFPLNFP